MTAREKFSSGVAVITGAGSGIGEGLAREVAAHGMTVVLADIAADRIAALAAEIEAGGGRALAVPTDVSDPGALDRLAARTHEAFGDVTLLVNNAGIETLGYSWELSAETWERILNVNIHGVVHGVRAFAPRMLAAGKPAIIANLSSIGGLGMMPIQTSYILSKHAVLSFSECLYLEMLLTGKPVQVSVVLPGPVATRIFAEAPTDGSHDEVAHHRRAMEQMLANDGISGREAARRILEGLAAGQFWVSTHPEISDAFAKARADYLANSRVPVLSERNKALLNQ
jgi:NADP-dependent 3-hydroxy acid dehydrogenase YdfG